MTAKRKDIRTFSSVNQFQGNDKQFITYRNGKQSVLIENQRPRRLLSVVEIAKPLVLSPKTSLIEFLLPKKYETTVDPEYVDFAKWAVVSSFFMTLSGIMSMQALLFAIGLSASAALPMSAALNWILKDGLGQLGGMFCASFINSKFDAHPKQWRFIAGGILDVAFLVETLTPMFPALFLPLASLANIGKNIGWISASASRAAIHRSFMRTENLADITAKAGSQSIFSSVLGTGVGITVAPFLNYLTGSDNIYVDSPLLVLGVTSLFCVCHLVALKKSLSFVAVKTFDVERLFTASFDKIALTSGNDALLTKQLNSATDEMEVSEANSLLREALSHESNKELLSEVQKTFNIAFTQFRTPKDVAKLENVVGLKALLPGRAMKAALGSATSELTQPLLTSPEVKFELSPNLSAFSEKEKLLLLGSLSSPSRRPFRVQIVERRSPVVCLLIEERATSSDVLLGTLASIFCTKLLERTTDLPIEVVSVLLAEAKVEEFKQCLQERGWDTKFHFLELENRRFLLNP